MPIATRLNYAAITAELRRRQPAVAFATAQASKRRSMAPPPPALGLRAEDTPDTTIARGTVIKVSFSVWGSKEG